MTNDEIARKIVGELYVVSDGNTLNKYTMYYWTEETMIVLRGLLDKYYPEQKEKKDE